MINIPTRYLNRFQRIIDSMRLPVLIAVVISVALLDLDAVHAQPTIRWLPQTAVLIQRGGDYGRMARLRDHAILCAYSRRSAIYVRRSDDNGKTWSPEILAVDYEQGKVTNAELLPLRSGRILLLYNERPSDGKSPLCDRRLHEQRRWGFMA